MTRRTTRQLLDMVKEGLLDKDTLILCCLNYMSEADVRDMAVQYELITEDDDEDEE